MAAVAAMDEALAVLNAKLASAEYAIGTPEEFAHVQACYSEMAAAHDTFAKAASALGAPSIGTRSAQVHAEAARDSLEAVFQSERSRIEHKPPRFLELVARFAARSEALNAKARLESAKVQALTAAALGAGGQMVVFEPQAALPAAPPAAPPAVGAGIEEGEIPRGPRPAGAGAGPGELRQPFAPALQAAADNRLSPAELDRQLAVLGDIFQSDDLAHLPLPLAQRPVAQLPPKDAEVGGLALRGASNRCGAALAAILGNDAELSHAADNISFMGDVAKALDLRSAARDPAQFKRKVAISVATLQENAQDLSDRADACTDLRRRYALRDAERQAWRRVSELQSASSSVAAAATIVPFKDAVEIMTKGTELEQNLIQGMARLSDLQRAAVFKQAGGGGGGAVPLPPPPRAQAAQPFRLGGDRACFHCNGTDHNFRSCAALADLFQLDPTAADAAWRNYSARGRGPRAA